MKNHDADDAQPADDTLKTLTKPGKAYLSEGVKIAPQKKTVAITSVWSDNLSDPNYGDGNGSRSLGQRRTKGDISIAFKE